VTYLPTYLLHGAGVYLRNWPVLSWSRNFPHFTEPEFPLPRILYNQRYATYTMFFIIITALHVSGGFSAHHQELIKLYVQPWVLSCFPAIYRWCWWFGTVQLKLKSEAEQFQLIHTGGRQQESMTTPKAAHTVL